MAIHVDMLRAGATQRVLPFRVMAPSTIGTFLRTFTFGHVRQLDAVASRVLKRVWATGVGPGVDRLVVDLDSTICEVHGKQKQAAGYGYTRVLGYHPLLATRAGTGEVLFARMRKGSANTARGVDRFVDELTANLKRAGATGPLTVRADSGFWSWKLIDRLNAHGIAWSITVRLHAKMKETIEAIDETAWVDIDYTLGGKAQVAEAIYTVGTGKKQRTVRLVVRRTRLTDKAQRRLWPDWRHHAFITSDHDISAIEADRFHREHAVVELAIRDLKEGAGLEHIPSGHYHANSAWLACSVLAHNLGIWADLIGGIPRRTHRSRRTQLVSLPAVIVNRSRRLLLRFPSQWPWEQSFHSILDAIRELPTPSG
ncbi:MAG TPA: IS1380 family transposase [Microthrixaceae bacterium]|nr:IS1380 family transposase [Microthrixaceae bacterium]